MPLPTQSMNRAAAQRIADSNPNATVYEYEYDHHDPWPVARVRRAVRAIRARAEPLSRGTDEEGAKKMGDDGAAQPSDSEADEVALFRRCHPTLASLAATDDPATQRLLDVLVDARGRAEEGALSEDEATAVVQAACMHSARTRQRE